MAVTKNKVSSGRGELQVFARNMKRLMKAANIPSGTELARITKKPPATVNRILNCRTPNPGILTLRELADFFDFSLMELMNGEVDHEGSLALSEDGQLLQIIPEINLEDLARWPAQKKQLAVSGSRRSQGRLSEDAACVVLARPSLALPQGTLLMIEPRFDSNLLKDNSMVVANINGQVDVATVRLQEQNALYLAQGELKSVPLTQLQPIYGLVVEVRMP